MLFKDKLHPVACDDVTSEFRLEIYVKRKMNVQYLGNDKVIIHPAYAMVGNGIINTPACPDIQQTRHKQLVKTKRYLDVHFECHMTAQYLLVYSTCCRERKGLYLMCNSAGDLHVCISRGPA